MKVNKQKTKAMKFSRSKTKDFPLEVSFSNNLYLEVVHEFKLLGIMIQDDLKWQKNTNYMCQKARGKIWLIRNMKKSGLDERELIDAYCKEVRSLLELAVPVWHSGLSKAQSNQIERIQKCSLAAILGEKYTTYKNALHISNLDTLQNRREKICRKFIQKNMASPYPLLQEKFKAYNTRDQSKKVKEFQCRTKAFFTSSLPFLARIHNRNK